MENIDNIFIYIIGPIITAVLSWFFTRRSYKQEIRKLKQENDESGFDYLKKLNDDLETRIQALQTQSTNLFNEVVALTNENRELKLSIANLQATINTLQNSLNDYEQRRKEN